ncbi:XRE family transcriptional regulator [Enterococcus faecium]|nr:XRE family transcriptional regulator [Enterococcus faecium]
MYVIGRGIVMLAEIIKIKRIERGLTQEELARIVGISRSYYSDIENNRTIPSGKVLLNLNKTLKFFKINDVNNGIK